MPTLLIVDDEAVLARNLGHLAGGATGDVGIRCDGEWRRGQRLAIATIEDHAVIEKILRHLGLPIDPPTPAPARVTGCLPGFETSADWATE